MWKAEEEKENEKVEKIKTTNVLDKIVFKFMPPVNRIHSIFTRPLCLSSDIV